VCATACIHLEHRSLLRSARIDRLEHRLLLRSARIDRLEHRSLRSAR